MNRGYRPLIIAHRGASADAPENTLAAFQLAIEQGCNGIELDVHLTKDGKLVVIHDDDIKRTTNGQGLVGDMTVAQLKAFDAGSWFAKQFKNERIPLLEEVLAIVPNTVFVNIEIKNIPAYYLGIEQKLVDLLGRMGRVNQVIVSSFDHQCLYRLKQQDPRIRIGLLYSENVVDHVAFAKMFGFPVTSLHPKYEAILAKDIRKAVENGIHVFPWTVNSDSSIRAMISQGVTGIITNHPQKMRKILDEYR